MSDCCLTISLKSAASVTGNPILRHHSEATGRRKEYGSRLLLAEKLWILPVILGWNRKTGDPLRGFYSGRDRVPCQRIPVALRRLGNRRHFLGAGGAKSSCNYPKKT